MNQYQRMICYLYEYNRGQKGANVGYVRLEQRGERCRVQIQMRGRNLETLPVAAFFKQENTGIHLLRIGEMQEGKGELYCRMESNAKHLLDTNHTLEEMDGVYLHVSEALYFASSWKLQDIFVGSLSWWGEKGRDEEWGEGDALPAGVEERQEERNVLPAGMEERQEEENALSAGMEELPEARGTLPVDAEERQGEGNALSTGAEERQEEGNALSAGMEERPEARGTLPVDTGERKEKEGVPSVEELEAQTVCASCPFKRKELDFGKRMLLTFPIMKPFGGTFAGSCVRIEPQDLGCLPMRYWPLSGNVFLMQGFYNYRHLIFMERSEGQYAVGVPGIYSDAMQQQSKKAGFSEFLAICGQRNCRGAFGYWLMSL